MQPHERAIIGYIGDLKQRLLELGILCGEPVEVIRKAPIGKPGRMRVARINYCAVP